MSKTVKQAMNTYVGVDFEGNAITQELPKAFMIMGTTTTKNVTFEFTFKGNGLARASKTRDFQFKVILPQEVEIISKTTFGLDGKFTLISLIHTYVGEEKGITVNKKQCLANTIMDKDGNYFGNMLDVASTIDLMNVLVHSSNWSSSIHNIYLKNVGRTKGKNSQSEAPVDFSTIDKATLLTY